MEFTPKQIDLVKKAGRLGLFINDVPLFINVTEEEQVEEVIKLLKEPSFLSDIYNTGVILNKISNCAKFDYSPAQIARICIENKYEREAFIFNLNFKGHEYYNEYQDSLLKAQYEIDEALYSKALDGDIDALDRFEERKAERKANGE